MIISFKFKKMVAADNTKIVFQNSCSIVKINWQFLKSLGLLKSFDVILSRALFTCLIHFYIVLYNPINYSTFILKNYISTLHDFIQFIRLILRNHT